jgi:hypothetical protein
MEPVKIARFVCASIFVFNSLSAVHVFAQEKSAPWWNPFAGGSESGTAMADGPVRDSSLFTGGKGAGSIFKLPDWTVDSKPSSSQKSPSAISRIGKTSKRWWDNTVDFVNPFDTPNKKFKQGYQPQYEQPQSKSGSGLFGWMWREETVESPTTVNDFLRQPRPKF